MINLLSATTIFDDMVQFLSTNMGVWYVILFNAFGVLAILTKVSEYQFKKRATRMIICSIASTCWALYFILQGQIVSSFANVVGMVQAIVFMQKDNHKWARSKWWLVLFLGLQFAVCIYGFRVWHDVFPLFGSIFGALAYFVIDEKAYRYFAILNMGFWLANSISKMPATLLALICDSTGTVSGLIGLARFYKRQKNDIEKQTDNTDTDKNTQDIEKDLVV